MPEKTPGRDVDAGAAPGTDVDVRAIRYGLMAIATGIAFALLLAYWMLHQRGAAANTPGGPFRAPAPLLQTAPQVERNDYFNEKARLTGSYGWVDRGAGIARIPVDEAMRLMAARAAPATSDASAASTPSAPAAPATSTKETR